MNNLPQVWETYQVAKLWRVRPSALLGIDDVYAAYCLDNAVALFGSNLEAELNSVKGKNDREIEKKRERLMTKWLGLPMKFKSPMATRSAKGDAIL